MTNAIREAELILARKAEKVATAVLEAAIEKKREFDAGIAEHNAEIERQLKDADNELERAAIKFADSMAQSLFSALDKQLSDKVAATLESAKAARDAVQRLEKKIGGD